MNTPDARLARALEWITRLPLLGEPELARLLGIDEGDARRLRLALERRGWVEWFVPGSDALRPRRLSFVREAALPDLARALRLGPRALAAHLAVRRSDVLERIVRVEVTASVNRFFAEFAAAPGPAPLELEEARSLPLALPLRERWWPADVQGYGCLRAGTLRAPFFVAWDRAGAPDGHRRRRARAWVSDRAGVVRWGAEGLPPVLLVSAGWRAQEAWTHMLGRAAERVATGPPGILIANARELASAGPAGVPWRDPASGREASLLEQLGWGSAPALQRVRLPDDVASGHPLAAASPLRRWAPRAAADSRTPVTERVAVIAMTTDGDQKRMLEWIGRWPLLTAPELASLAGMPEAAVERRLDSLLRYDVVRSDTDAPFGEPPVTRLLLTSLGLRLLARRDGVPPRRYARSAGVSAPVSDPGSGPTLRGTAGAFRHRAHLLGVNRVFARLASDARGMGGRLAVCRNEAQSTRRFRHDGRAAWIRPDGSGVIALGGGHTPFLLEYDRGTLDSGDFAAKFGGYRRYFLAGAWRQDFDAEPLLLFVCADDRAEEHVARAARRAERGSLTRLPLRLTAEWRFGQGTPIAAGLLGPIWQSPHVEPDEHGRRTGTALRFHPAGLDATISSGREEARA